MHDIPPDRALYWSALERTVADVFARYAFREIRLPIVESTHLFSRSIGDATDIVEKEMYSFPDRHDESLSLRPEGTAGCVRACIELNLLSVAQKLWYAGPMFRYERPQKGRQRQFHQIGAEVFGYPGAAIEAELLLLCQRLWSALGIAEVVHLELNTIGSSRERAIYRESLVAFLQQHRESLDADSQRRIDTNPLRVLDSKNPATQAILDDAPALRDFLSAESLAHESQLLALLDASGIAYRQNPRLVRGLDYYNDTVFEWVTDQLGAQGTICAGGRYDVLVEQLGGKPVPAVGFAMGVERLYLLLESLNFSALPVTSAPDCFVIVDSEQRMAQGLAIAESLRSTLPQLHVLVNFAMGSIKSQFKKADKSGARFALVLGENEAETECITVKDLSVGEQVQIPQAELATMLQSVLGVP